MENKALFAVYLAVWFLYVVGIHGYTLKRRLKQAVVALSHAVPSLVAISMLYIFLIGHGATVRQFVAHSEQGMDLWSLWVSLWPLLLLATFGSGVAHVIWALVVFAKLEWREWMPVSVLGAGMSVFSFMTVLANFPDA